MAKARTTAKKATRKTTTAAAPVKKAPQAKATASASADDTSRADLSVFNRYLAQVTSEFKAPQSGRKPKAEKEGGSSKERRLAALEEKRASMTAAQYLRKRKTIEAGSERRPGRQPEDLRGRFLEALPRIMEREGWSPQDLQNIGVPYADLVEIGVRKPRGPRAGA